MPPSTRRSRSNTANTNTASSTTTRKPPPPPRVSTRATRRKVATTSTHDDKNDNSKNDKNSNAVAALDTPETTSSSQKVPPKETETEEPTVVVTTTEAVSKPTLETSESNQEETQQEEEIPKKDDMDHLHTSSTTTTTMNPPLQDSILPVRTSVDDDANEPTTITTHKRKRSTTTSTNKKRNEGFTNKNHHHDSQYHKRKIQKLKMKLFREAPHQFPHYWQAVSEFLQTGHHHNMQRFLSTRSLRKLHNALVLRKYSTVQCVCTTLRTHTPSNELTHTYIYTHIELLKNCIHTSEVVVSNQNHPDDKTTTTVSQKKRTDSPYPERLFVQPPPLYHNLQNNHKQTQQQPQPQTHNYSYEHSLRLPGVLILDPRIRNMAKMSGMKVTEGAVSLIIIAFRQNIERRLRQAIQIKEQQQPKTTACITKDDNHEKQLTSWDVQTACSILTPRVASRTTLERIANASLDGILTCLAQHKDNTEGMVLIRDYVRNELGKIAEQDGIPLVAPLEASSQEIPSLDESSSSQKSTVMDAQSSSRGLGRGAKDLAALKARTSQAKLQSEESKPPAEQPTANQPFSQQPPALTSSQSQQGTLGGPNHQPMVQDVRPGPSSMALATTSNSSSNSTNNPNSMIHPARPVPGSSGPVPQQPRLQFAGGPAPGVVPFHPPRLAAPGMPQSLPPPSLNHHQQQPVPQPSMPQAPPLLATGAQPIRPPQPSNPPPQAPPEEPSKSS